ncbi:XrtB/PEP-CTERM-associated polysaccharide biosynthesis outer membrane protein EpsL [Duganella vulcania]|uniref:XrtB/PEP-CTERM-associated polysaccharide biosynthesis outer membrane protein EpsL n=1 Tax=Duganella vulcania TaxID=2692166 RepID=UPI0020C3FC29|nr:XrtB/PEP-CTERM-associated polysaccharide biosynthesis outer membrane protein EpsL [Duganella vulcania]
MLSSQLKKDSCQHHLKFTRLVFLPRSLALLLGTAVCVPAAAALSDTIHPFVVVGYNYDDNLFRLPDEAPGFTGSRSDTMLQTAVGASFERPLGRQILTGQAKVSNVKFSHYDQLNYNGKDFLAALEWHLGNHLEGHVGGKYAQTLTPFTDFHGNERNLRVQRREYVDGAWRFHPSWQVRGGYSEEKFTYDLLSQRYNNHTEDVAFGGVDFLASSGSRVGLQLRHLKGAYPNHRQIGSTTVDDGYTQDELKADVNWAFSGTTQLQMLVGWARREHVFFSQRNSSGANGKGNLVWRPLGKVSLTLSGWREFSAVESTFISNSFNKGVSVAAGWDISAKLRADASWRRERRQFDTINGLVLPGAIEDSTRSVNAGLTYAPMQAVQLNAGVFRESRTGSPFVGTNNYRVNGASFSVSAQF